MNAWIARDSCGDLFLYDKKPECYGDYFMGDDVTFVCCLPDEMYPEVTFGNSPLELVIEH